MPNRGTETIYRRFWDAYPASSIDDALGETHVCLSNASPCIGANLLRLKNRRCYSGISFCQLETVNLANIN